MFGNKDTKTHEQGGLLPLAHRTVSVKICEVFGLLLVFAA